jgi:hypothetical protein
MIRTEVVRFGSLCSLAVALISIATCKELKAQASELAPVQTRILQAIDESQRVTLYGNTHPLAMEKYDRGPAPVSMPASRLLLVLRRSAQQEAVLNTYLQSLQDPASPNFGKWLTPEEFGTRFGVSDADLAKVQGWLQGQGFTINKVAKGRMAIEFSGTVGQVQTAFATSIHSYVVNGEQHWANTTNPQIPAALEPVVAGLAALNNFVPKSQVIKGPMGSYNPATERIEPEYTVGNSTSGYYLYVFPADAATIYDTPTSLNANFSGTQYDGTGVTIGIAGDSNIDVTQNANYRATFGLPPNPTTVVVDGEDPGENGDALEAYLDTQVSGGIAPGAKVILYTAQNTYLDAGLFLGIIRALDDNQADILNVSFGGCEAFQGASGNQFIYNLWEQAAAQGIPVTVSSGDSGSAGCDDPHSEALAQYGEAVNGLGSTPFNIAVGGTDFDALYDNFTQYVNVTNTLPNHRSALKYIPEEPWNNSTFLNQNTTVQQNESWAGAGYAGQNIVAAGGGVSSCVTGSFGACESGYPLPTWQSGFGKDTTGRNLPDVSFLAGNALYRAAWGLCTDLEVSNPNCVAPATGNNFSVTGVGGTSAAAPTFAGMLALVEQKVGSRLGQADYVLYKLAKTKYSTVFHDITTGNISVYCQQNTPDCQLNTRGYYFLLGYDTATGYDEATGLGSVDANQMVTNWSSAALTATSSSLKLNGGTAALNLTHGAAVTVNVGVTGSGGTPAGDVALVDSIDPATLPNNDSIGLFALTSGTVTGTTNYLPGGSYNVSAHYGGSSTFAGSDSNSIAVTVSPESSSTSLKVVGYYDPVSGLPASTPYYGFIYLIDAQPYGNSASASSPNGAATGTITFKSGTTTLGTAALASDGIAELQTETLPGGTDSLTAVFPGDASFNASTSTAVSFSVVPAVGSLNSVVFPPGSVVAGTNVTFKETLSIDSAGAAPAGTVTLKDGSTTIGSVPMNGTAATSTVLAGGSASFSTATLTTGTHSIQAIYSGDGNYGSITTNIGAETITAAQVSAVVIPPSSGTPTNQPVAVTVNLIPTLANGLQAPTGTVTLAYNSVTSPAVNVSNSSATITIPANTLPVGSTSVTANYSGDQYYASASALAAVNMIGSGTIKPNIKVTGPTVTVNYPVTVTVAITGTTGSPAATGSVTLNNGSTYGSQSVPLTNGSATFVIQNSLTPGLNTLTATYLGDNNYTNGTGTGSVTLFATANVSFANHGPTIIVNQPLTVTVNLSNSSGVAAPTGTVTLTSGTYTSAPAAIVANAAAITIPANALALGTDTLTASYSGDVNFAPSVGSEPVTVNPVPTPDFKVVGTNVTLTAGATAGNTSTVTVTPDPTAGFTGAVTLTASITAQPPVALNIPTLSFGSTSPVNIAGTTAGTAMMTVSTMANTSGCASSLEAVPRTPWLAGGGAALALVLLCGIPARRRRWRTMLGLVALLMALMSGVSACGGGGTKACNVTAVPGTTLGTYTATITATSGTITHTATVTITVN